jgi:hypothetical protein
MAMSSFLANSLAAIWMSFFSLVSSRSMGCLLCVFTG